MSRRNGGVSLLGFITLAFLLLMGPDYAGAAPVGTYSSELNAGGQTFWGDGAVYGGGYLQAPAANTETGEKCLECHQAGTEAPNKTSYLRTGHGNMVKKVSASQVWRGATAQPHSATNPFGHVIDWSTGSGRVNLGGYCDVGGFEGQFSQEDCEAATACTLAKDDFISPAYTKATCEAGGGTWKKGVWTPAERWVDIIYFVGDWMGSAAGYVDTGIKIPERPNKFMMADGRQYGTCGSCHNTGYKDKDYTRVQPYADYPNFAKNISSGAQGSWVLNGIQCERCHDATPTLTGGNPTVPDNTSSTFLCSQCHIRPAAWELPGTANPAAATAPTAYPIGASATNFGSHLIGKQFLNSPHGKFTGAISEIATGLAKYNSAFGPAEGTQGGCDTCHDVHESTVAPAKTNFGAEGIRRGCDTCHTEQAESVLALHPTGTGTPSGDSEEASGACVKCHMPKPGGDGLNVHVFRINTDPDYSTFPKQVNGVWTPGYCSDPTYTTRDTCVAAGKSWAGVAKSAPDGTYTNAVWVDLDLACGQCHGEEGSAHLMSKGITATYAAGMHSRSSIPSTCSGCHSDTTTAHPAGTNTPAECSDCHGRAGVKPTIEAACITCHSSTGVATHQFTEAQIKPYAEAMHAGGSTPSTTCTACHAETPEELINHPNKTCTNCHSTPKPGVKPTYAQACNSCHGEGNFMSQSYLATAAESMHQNIAPQASIWIDPAIDIDPVLEGIQVNIGDAVRVMDTSTDPNGNIVSVLVKWGNGKSVTDLGPGGTASYSYPKAGKKTITVTTTDSKGLKSKKVKYKVTVVK